MSKTLYISDLDGTLLLPDATVSEYTVNTINRLINNGLNFSVATARTAATCDRLLGDIKINIPIILMNGVIVYDFKTKKCINKALLSEDAKNKVITTKCITKGDISSVPLSPRQVVEFALANQASAIILAHNHPNGFALPSSDDYSSTRKIQDALKAVDVRMLDHIIVADDDFVSMADNGFFNRY